MAVRLLCYVALCLLGTGFMDVHVSQTPRYRVSGTGKKITLECSQTMDHENMYWYRQDPGKALQLIHYSYGINTTEEVEVSSGSTVSRIRKDHFPLTLEPTRPSQTSLYLCASSKRQGTGQLYFGTGSKLTVLEDLKQVKPPKVTVFEPSEAEISRTQKATLVCLATGFYPDHVELSWWVNRKQVHKGVSTDPQPYKEEPTKSASNYCLSSRLRVSATFWHNPRNHFRCQVQFYGLEKDEQGDNPKAVTQNVSADTQGKADCGYTSESYQQGVLSATILYEILLGKATLYAVLVSVLVLMAKVKRKGS